MRKPTRSELESYVAAAERRAAESVPTRAEPDRYPGLHSSRQRAEGIVTDALTRLGVNLSELDRLRLEHDAEMRRFTEEAKQRTIAGFADASQRVEAAVRAQRTVLGAVSDWRSGGDLILSVDSIQSWPNSSNLRDSHREPGLNWAKYAVRDSQGVSSGRTREKVSFYILWQNPKAATVFADILVRLTVNGDCGCSADGRGVASWWLPDSQSSAEVSASLTLWGLWTEEAPQWIVDTVPLASLSATGKFFGGSKEASISQAPGVATTGFPVPASANVLIEASVAVDYELFNGAIDADFASSNLFSVGCPFAVVTLK